MRVDQKIQRLIKDYFNGQLSGEEEADLLQWMRLSEDNKKYFFQYKEELDPQTIEHPELKSSLIELKNKLVLNQQFNSTASGKTRKLWFNIARVAAILIVGMIMGITVSYFFTEKANSKREVVWFETYVPRGEKSQLILPDGSKVWVNSESSISYPSNFMEGNRDVKLTGEAYFEVEKKMGMPFIVETKDFNINVLGTKFNVMAYADFNRTETSLLEGEIEIEKGTQRVAVSPGESFVFCDNKFSISKTNVQKTLRWKDDIFDFDRTTFRELILRLERWYDVDIEVQNPEINEIMYSGIFKNEETIWQVLNTLQLTLPIKYERVDFRNFLIKEK